MYPIHYSKCTIAAMTPPENRPTVCLKQALKLPPVSLTASHTFTEIIIVHSTVLKKPGKSLCSNPFTVCELYIIQHCFICRNTDSTVMDGIHPRTVTILALAVRRSLTSQLDLNHKPFSHLPHRVTNIFANKKELKRR